MLFPAHPLQESSSSDLHKVDVQVKELLADANSEKKTLSSKTIDALDRVLRDPTLHLIELQTKCHSRKVHFDFKTALIEYQKGEDKLKV